MDILKKAVSSFRLFIKIALPVCLIAGGVAGFQYYRSREVKMKRKPPKKQVAMVETVAVSPGTYTASVHAMGTVLADRQIVLKARITGEVTKVCHCFVQGGLIRKGTPLVRLDDSDYALEVQKAQSILDRALSDLAIERGNQHIAKEELKLVSKVSPGNMGPTDLALRKPQLVQAKAVVAGARVDLEKARLNLSRTVIKAPFNALVLEKNVDKGSLVAAQSLLATLVCVDQYQVEVQVPLDRLDKLTIHETKGSRAIVRSLYSDFKWQGRVVRTTGRITGQGRMAGVIVELKDPLGLKAKDTRPRLLLDDYVDVRMIGHDLEKVYALPRSLVRENNTIWVFRAQKLVVQTAEPVWKEADQVFVHLKIQPGDRIITSDLPAPVPGMALKLREKESS